MVRKYYNNPQLQVGDFTGIFNKLNWRPSYGGKSWGKIG